MTRASLVLVLGVVLLSGCPRSRDGGGGGGDVPIDGLMPEIISAYCDLLLRCDFGGSDASGIRLLLGDATRCRDYLGRAFESDSEVGPLIDAVNAGRIVYDAAAARACIDTVRSGCSASLGGADFDGACDDVFSGTIAEGGDCWFDSECAPGLGCDFASGTCPGACAPGAGGFICDTTPCSEDEECFYPDGGTTPRCVTPMLGADAAEGQPCGLVEEGAESVTRRACAPGLWCTGNASTIGTCRAPIAAGAPCTSEGDRCVDGHFCAGGSCRAVTIVRTPGGPCDEAMLQICDPLLRLECQSGACVEITDGNAGSPCRGGDFSETTCDEGLVCHRDTMTCGAPKSAGAGCESDDECASGSCDFTAMTCRDRYCSA